MKKTLLLLAIAITQCLTISAGYEAQTISWNLKNADSGGIGETLKTQQLNGIDSTKNGVDYSIAATFDGDVTNKGIYVSSCKETRNEYVKIKLPAGTAGTIDIKYLLRGSSQAIAFYYLLLPDTSSVPATLIDASGKVSYYSDAGRSAATTIDIPAFNINLIDKTCSHILYLFTTGDGGRYNTIKWTETAVAPNATWTFYTDPNTSPTDRNNVSQLNKNNKLAIEDVQLAFISGTSKRELEFNTEGSWWHNSGVKDGGAGEGKKDNTFNLTVPGGCVGKISLTFIPQKGATYTFYVFEWNGGTQPTDMYANLGNAITHIEQTYATYAQTTIDIPLNLLGKDRDTYSVIFLQNGGDNGGLRIKTLQYSYSTPMQGLTISESDVEHITKPISTSTPLKANIQRSNLSSSNYNTICLPFSMDAGQIEDAFGENCELYTLSSKSTEGGVITLNFTSASTITEGTPYLIKPADDINWSTPLYGTTIGSDAAGSTSVTDVTFYGAYTPTQIETTDYFLGTNDLLYHPIPSDRTIKGLRGYFRITNPSGAPVRCAFNQTDTPTNLENQFTDSPIHRFTKIIKDGQLLIEHNNTYIDLMGRTIK